MKRKNIIIALSGLVVFTEISLSGKDHFLTAQNDNSAFQIDSLINVQKPDDATVLIQFGGDAVTAIATEKGIVVIDAGISTGLTTKYRNIIEKEFHRNDFAYLINSHGHPDHNGGNRIFADATIVGHENCLQEIADQWKNPEKVKKRLLEIVNEYETDLQSLKPGTEEWNEVFCQKSRYQYAYKDVVQNSLVLAPNVTFNDCMDMDMGDATFNLFFFGKAHSESDILIHVPEKKILLVGDLFSKYGRPSIRDDTIQDIERWATAVKWIESRWSAIDLVIGGHGLIMTKEELQSFCNNIRKISRKN